MSPIYYLYADLGGTYCEAYAATEEDAKIRLFLWLTYEGFTGAIPKSCIRMFVITEEMKQESCTYRLENGRELNFSIDGFDITVGGQ